MTCLPGTDPQFCLTPGLGSTLVFEYEPDYNLALFTEARFTAKASMDPGATVVIQKTGSIDPDNHRVTFPLTPSNTEALRPGWLYWYDVALMGSSPAIASGRFSVAPIVTDLGA